MFTEQQKKSILEVKSRFEIKNLKTFTGREGVGVSAVLYEKGKKVADISDYADGGPINISDYKFVDKLNVELDMKVGTFVEDSFGNEVTLTYDAEILIDELINESLFDKQVKPKCKKKTLFITKDCKKDEYRSYAFEYTPKLAEQIRKKHGDELVEIINERYL